MRVKMLRKCPKGLVFPAKLCYNIKRMDFSCCHDAAAVYGDGTAGCGRLRPSPVDEQKEGFTDKEWAWPDGLTTQCKADHAGTRRREAALFVLSGDVGHSFMLPDMTEIGRKMLKEVG